MTRRKLLLLALAAPLLTATAATKPAGVRPHFDLTRAEIRETIGGIENEFYGHFYATVVPVPEPAAASLLLVGSIGFGFQLLRKRK